jgi:hypothetical protein
LGSLPKIPFELFEKLAASARHGTPVSFWEE